MSRQNILFRGLLALLFGCCSVPAIAQQSVATALRDSLSALNRQIDLQPRSTDLRLKKAALNIELGQWDYAVDEYGRVLDIDEHNPAALYYRAYAYTHLRRYDLARYDYESFLSLIPRHFEARLGLAMVKRLLGKKQEAMDELNILVEHFPDSAMAYAARAGYEDEVGQFEAALYDWDKAISLSPLNADFVVSKVEMLLRKKRKKEARSVLEQAIVRGIPRALLADWLSRVRS